MPSSTVTGNKRTNHTRLIMRNRSRFCKIISDNKYKCFFFLFRTTFSLSSKAMWVAIDCRSKNWFAVLKSLGSAGLMYNSELRGSAAPNVDALTMSWRTLTQLNTRHDLTPKAEVTCCLKQCDIRMFGADTFHISEAGKLLKVICFKTRVTCSLISTGMKLIKGNKLPLGRV
jgi:hypothetical protein